MLTGIQENVAISIGKGEYLILQIYVGFSTDTKHKLKQLNFDTININSEMT